MAKQWPTATRQDSASSGAQYPKTETHNPGTTLTDAAARNWKTPHGFANTDRFGKTAGAGGEMAKQAQEWATPTSHERTQTPRKVDHGKQLANQADDWPTPRVSMENGPSEREIAEGNPKTRIETEAAIWQTPKGTGGGNVSRGNDRSGELLLAGQAQAVCPTGPPAPPTTKHGSTSSPAGPNSRRLWVTPITYDAADRRVNHRKDESNLTLAGQTAGIERNTKRRLNPLFVEWLMGFPLNWTRL